MDSGKSTQAKIYIYRFDMQKFAEESNSSTNVLIFLTSNDAEKLLDPHVDVDAAEELLHMTTPALEDGTTNVI